MMPRYKCVLMEGILTNDAAFLYMDGVNTYLYSLQFVGHLAPDNPGQFVKLSGHTTYFGYNTTGIKVWRME